MVIKLLCLSIWMSVPMLAMEEGQQESSVSPAKVKPPKLYTGIDDLDKKIRAAAYKDGLMVGRKEGEEQIKALQMQQELLIKCMQSAAEMNRKLSADLQQSREQLEAFQSSARTIAEQFHTIIILNKSFEVEPKNQVKNLQNTLHELKKLVL